ncbi:MAG TPA: hypothetical protein VE669_06160 [Actinomycetota bacterium]|jgi:hypothetical protein|nr:hypothetical protein [Actinomycetota bacterium]
MRSGEECWAVETSRDGERWRFFGRAWKGPNEPVLLHAVPRFIRFRQLLPSEDREWCAPLEADVDGLPMTLLRMEERVREELWPDERHLGLPVLLPGGEEGRLLRFEHAPDGSTWSYALEFRGARDA